MYNKISNIILSWIFPELKKVKENNLLQVITQYFLLVNEIPYDRYRIEFCDKNEVQIYIIYDSAEIAANTIKINGYDLRFMLRGQKPNVTNFIYV